MILWLAIVNTAIAFSIWNATLRELTAAESSITTNTMPIQISIMVAVVWREVDLACYGWNITDLYRHISSSISIQI